MQPVPATVYLVGAGPGDPGMITLWGAECLRRAEVVLYDYLANPALLEHAPDAAERVCLGHHRTGRTMPQDEVHARMVEAARAGRVVVRLKGGDPSIFARTADETTALRAAGVPYQIIPGITTGLAVRGIDSSSVALVTGHERPGKGGAQLDYGALAEFPGTVVFYMGVTSAPDWSRAMMDRGLPAETPVTVIRRCTRPDQELLHIALAEVGPSAQRGAIRPPAVFVIENGNYARSADSTLNTQCGVLLAAHGARDDRTVAAARALAAMVARHLGGVPSELGFLEFLRPTIAEGLDRLAKGGVRQILLVPLFLARGAHVERDIPAIVAEFARSTPAVATDVAQHVGAWPAMLELAAQRTRDAMGRRRALPADTTLLLIAHGSRREGALEETRRFTQSLAARLGIAQCHTAFAVMGRPGLEQVPRAVEPLPGRHVAIYPHFLFPGQMVDTVVQMAATWQRAMPDRKWFVADPPGPDPELAAGIALAAGRQANGTMPR